MSFRSDIASDAAAAHVSVCQDCFEQQLTYTLRGTDILVWAMPKSSTKAAATILVGSRVVKKYRTFEIATQTGFAPQGETLIDDTITDENGDVYRVAAVNNPDDVGAVWIFEGVYKKTHQLGQVGQS